LTTGNTFSKLSMPVTLKTIKSLALSMWGVIGIFNQVSDKIFNNNIISC